MKSKKYELVKCPLVKDNKGVLRFQENRIVTYLLDNGGIDLNRLACLAFEKKWSKKERAQFAQLIGYSLDGWSHLHYVIDEIFHPYKDDLFKL